jgi:translation initiation factor IF-1
MSKTTNKKLKGVISSIHSNAFFSVKVENLSNPIICYLGSKVSRLPSPVINDPVTIEVYPMDLTKGRIISYD